MGLFHIFFQRDTSFLLKVKALFNIFGIAYFTVMVTAGIIIAVFVSIPKLVEAHNFSVTKHYLLASFLGVNIIGNYLLTVFTDTSTATLPPNTIAQHQDVRQGKVNKKRLTRGLRHFSGGKGGIHHFGKKKRMSSTDFIQPWRAFDCRLCNSCILKRDHHCFFIGYCIGYHNQKYFIQCCAYLVCGCCYSLMLTSIYLHTSYGTQFQGMWTFFYLLPLTIISWLHGNTPIGEMGLILFLYITLVGGGVGIGFCLWESHITCQGLTTYEAMHGLSIPWKRSFRDNFCDVFGKYWYIGMVIPVKLPQYGNGTYLGAD